MASKRPAADPPTSPHSGSFSDDEDSPNHPAAASPKRLSDEDDDYRSLSTDDSRGQPDDDSETDLSAQSDPSRSPPRPPQRPARGVDPSIKPLKSLPMDAIAPPSQPRSKRPKSAASPSVGKSGGKKRLWSPEDELTVVRGLLSYRAKNGGLPASAQEMETFHRLIRGSLTIKVSTIQLSDKVRGLKRKFTQAVLQGKEVASASSPDSHHKTLFDLSKSVWGSSSNSNSNSNKSSAKNTAIQAFDFGGNDMDVTDVQNGHADGRNGNKSKGKGSYPFLAEVVEKIASEDPNGALLRRAFLGIDKSKAAVMEKKIKKFRTEEIEQGLKRIDLVKETVKLFLDGLRKSE